MMIDLGQEVLRFKLETEKVNLKLTPRSTVFKSKQIKEFLTYIRQVRAARKNTTVEELAEGSDYDELSHFDVSCL